MQITEFLKEINNIEFFCINNGDTRVKLRQFGSFSGIFFNDNEYIILIIIVHVTFKLSYLLRFSIS